MTQEDWRAQLHGAAPGGYSVRKDGEQTPRK